MCSRAKLLLPKFLRRPTQIESETCRVERFGEVVLIRKKGLKQLRISMKPFGPIEVSYPYSCSAKEALRFLEQKEAWIQKARKRLEKFEQKTTRFGPGTTFATRFHTLLLESRDDATHFILKRGNPSMILYYPPGVDFETEQSQQVVKQAITEILRFEANSYLPSRVSNLAARLGLTPAGVTVKNNLSRWGSCSPRNAIHLNIHLMRLPEFLSDYVILHELAHITEKNHGAAFWLLLDRYCGGEARRLDKALKEYRISVY